MDKYGNSFSKGSGHQPVFDALNEAITNNPDIGDAFNLLYSIDETYEFSDVNVLNAKGIYYMADTLTDITIMIYDYEIVYDLPFILK